MRLWTLGSGSRGNAVLLESSTGESRVLIDAGFPPRVLAARLRGIGIAAESIEAVVVTHEHGDHVRGVAPAAARWGWAVHASAGTAAACAGLGASASRTRCFAAGDTIEVGSWSLLSVPTSHDAVESCAFVATDRASGARAGIVYDLGRSSPAVERALASLDVLVLEANHDEAMLAAGPYPRSVQARIAGPRGHLSNGASGAIARRCAHRALAHLVLAHLSEVCNTPGMATRTVARAIAGSGFGGQLHAAAQHAVCGPFTGGRGRRAEQLALAL